MKFFSKRVRCFSLVLGIVFSFFSTGLSGREWRDVDNRKITAEYVSHDKEKVTLRLAGGKDYKFPLVRLSEEDREFVTSGKAKESLSKEKKGESDEQDGGDGDLNWDDPWPDSVKFEEKLDSVIEREDAEKKVYVYTSPNYRYTCDVRLSKSVVDSFADLFEATLLYCRTLPLAIDGGVKNNGKYDIVLFETEAEYIRAGGAPGTAGVYSPKTNTVMVPLSGLGVRKVGSGYMKDRDKDNSTLSHELSHQLTPTSYFREGVDGWFTEGLAEYISLSPYRSGRFNVRGNLDEIEAMVSGYGKDDKGGRALGEEFTAPHLADFMSMPYREFAGADGNFNYGFSTLLVTYLCRMDGNGDAALVKEMLKKVRSEPRDSDVDDLLKIILNGRSYEELQKEFSEAWRKEGIKVSFRERIER